MTDFTKIECKICGERVHYIEPHALKSHNMPLGEYVMAHPEAPLMSAVGQAAKDALMANPMVDGNIKSLFGIEISKGIKTIPMFSKPAFTTPAIDPFYCFDREDLLITLYAMMKPHEYIYYVGPTGSGKSTIVEQTAARLNWGYTRINLDGDLGRADLIGEWKLIGGETVWKDGLIPQAMREGRILLLDERDCLDPSVGMALQAVLEGKRLTITETSEVVMPHPNFRMFATGNTIGQGDSTGLYNGTQTQNFASMDRLGAVHEVDYPNKAREIKVITGKTGIDDSMILDKLTEVANLVRAAHKKGDMVGTMSTRTILNVATKLVDFGDIQLAYKWAFFNKLNADDKTLCKEIVQRVWGKAA